MNTHWPWYGSEFLLFSGLLLKVFSITAQRPTVAVRNIHILHVVIITFFGQHITGVRILVFVSKLYINKKYIPELPLAAAVRDLELLILFPLAR